MTPHVGQPPSAVRTDDSRGRLSHKREIAQLIFSPCPTRHSGNRRDRGTEPPPTATRRISTCFCRSRLRPAIPRCAHRAEMFARKNLRFFRDSARKKRPLRRRPTIGRPSVRQRAGSGDPRPTSTTNCRCAGRKGLRQIRRCATSVAFRSAKDDSSGNLFLPRCLASAARLDAPSGGCHPIHEMLAFQGTSHP